MIPADSPTPSPTLSPPDAQAVDCWLQAHTGSLDSESSSADPARQHRVASLLALLNHWPVEEPSPDLIDRTLAGIRQLDRQRRLAVQIQALAAGRSWSLAWRELAAVAAVVLIGLSLLWPVLAWTRQEARRLACQSRLGAAATALSNYAADHAGLMPRLATQPGLRWARVGLPPGISPSSEASNSANLLLLARTGYIHPADLSCPDNPYAPRNLDPRALDWPDARSVSYSYQNQFTSHPLRLDQVPTLAVLADKNPLLAPHPADPRRLILRMDLPASASSFFHRQRGQNVLQAAGHVSWLTHPSLPNDDSIWTARDRPLQTLDEIPSGPDDSMLIP